MKAMIKKIELKKFMNNYYLKIILSDIEGHTFIIDKPFSSNPINFRKQVFGIMTACDCYDLMRLTTDSPIYKNVIGYYMNGLKIFENEKGEWFSYNSNKGEYICDKIEQNKLKLLETMIEQNVFSIEKLEGTIANIESRSGTFSLLFNGKCTSTFYTCGQQIYYGFGYPISIGDPSNIESTKRAAKTYTSFIVNLMKFYGIDDLLYFGGNIDKFPIVDVTLNNNKVDLITNPNTGLGFSINEKYKFISLSDRKKQKIK